MSDFIREVNEDYRRDRVVGFFVKHQVRLIALVVALLVAIAGYRIYIHYHAQAAESASVRYEAAVRLAHDGKSAEAQAAFDKLQGDAPAGYANLARLQAIEALATRDAPAAARGYEAMGADGSVDASLRDVAQVRAALIRVDSDDPVAFEKRYATLAAPAFTFHSTIRELLAMAAFKRNDYEAASRWLDEIIVDQQAPAALRSRAEAFLSLVAAGPTQVGTPEPPKPVIPLDNAPPVAVPAPTISEGPAATAPVLTPPPAAPVGAPLQIVPLTPEPTKPEPTKPEPGRTEPASPPAAAIPSQSPSPNPAGAQPAH